MIYQGETLTVSYLEDGIAETMGFSQQAGSLPLLSLSEADRRYSNKADLEGSDPPPWQSFAYHVGADITEFLELFDLPPRRPARLAGRRPTTSSAPSKILVPTLPPSRAMLSGGCETILSTDFRLADTSAKIGLPETKLGIMPGTAALSVCRG